MHIAYALYSMHETKLGPCTEIVKSFAKYGILNMLKNAIDTGIVMRMGSAKRLIKSSVMSHEEERFRCTTMMYNTLQIYNQCIDSIQMCPWWTYIQQNPGAVKKCMVLLRMLVGQTCFRCDTYRFGKHSNLCVLCDQFVPETLQHVFF